MLNCEQAREHLALHPSGDGEDLRLHLAQCVTCASYRQRHQVLDAVLRDELRWEAPAMLTARLLALAAVGVPATQLIARPRPKRWYVTVVYTLTMLVVVLSMLVAWQFFGLLAMQIGLDDALTRLLDAPAQGLAQIAQVAQTMPESRYVIDFFLKARDQLMWLLLVGVLWAALDAWNPPFSFRRQQA